jgi:heme exporter protein C
MNRARLIDTGLLLLASTLLGFGAYHALSVAPPERYMGEVYRILYVHVPSAWSALIAFTVTFAANIAYLWKSRPGADALAEASAEVGLLFCGLLLASGSIFARPTWGVWWQWDPRLTTAAIMFFAYAGYMALRQFVTDPEKRATWSAVVGILIFVDVPIVYFSVKWFGAGLHQLPSSPQTTSPALVTALRLNAFAFLALYGWFLRLRYRLARNNQTHESMEPPAVRTA